MAKSIGSNARDLLRHHALFAALTDEEFDGLQTLLELTTVASGSTITREGDAADSVAIVVRGSVDLTRQTSPEPVAHVGPGGLFGELTLGSNVSARQTTSVAKGETTVVVVRRDKIWLLHEQNPQLGMKLLRALHRTLPGTKNSGTAGQRSESAPTKGPALRLAADEQAASRTGTEAAEGGSPENQGETQSLAGYVPPPASSVAGASATHAGTNLSVRPTILQTYRSRGLFLSHYLFEDGVGGVFVPGMTALRTGTHVDLELEFADAELSFNFRGIVRWKRVGRGPAGTVAGVGIEFLPSQQRAREFLVEFVEGRANPPPRRRPRRLPVMLPVQCQVETSLPPSHHITYDLAERGAFILTKTPWPVGTKMPLTLLPPSPHLPMPVLAEVRWNRANEPAGVGVSFVADDAVLGSLDALMRDARRAVAQHRY